MNMTSPKEPKAEDDQLPFTNFHCLQLTHDSEQKAYYCRKGHRMAIVDKDDFEPDVQCTICKKDLPRPED